MIVLCGACGARSRVPSAHVPPGGARMGCPQCQTELVVAGPADEDEEVLAQPADAYGMAGGGNPLEQTGGFAAVGNDPFGQGGGTFGESGMFGQQPQYSGAPGADDTQRRPATRAGVGAGDELSEPEMFDPSAMRMPWQEDLARVDFSDPSQGAPSGHRQPVGAAGTQLGMAAMSDPSMGQAAFGQAGPRAADQVTLFGAFQESGSTAVRAPPLPPGRAGAGAGQGTAQFAQPQDPFAGSFGDDPGSFIGQHGGQVISAGAPGDMASFMGRNDPAATAGFGAGSASDLFGGMAGPVPGDTGVGPTPRGQETTAVKKGQPLKAAFTALNLAPLGAGESFGTMDGYEDPPLEQRTQKRAMPKPPPGPGGLDALFDEPADDNPNAPSPSFAPLISPNLPPGMEAGAGGDMDFLSQIPDIDQGAAGSGVSLFRVRRPNGKVFGPYPMNVIVDMIRAGKLSGTEDVSTDGESFVPITDIAELAFAIEQSGVNLAQLQAQAQAGMAGVAVGDAASPELLEERRRLEEEKAQRQQQDIFRTRTAAKAGAQKMPPLYFAVGAVGLLVVGVMGYFAFGGTDTKQVGADECLSVSCSSPQRQEKVRAAEELVFRDTYPDSEQAVNVIDDILRSPQFPGRIAVEAFGAGLRYLHIVRFGERPSWEEEAEKALNGIRALLPPGKTGREIEMARGLRALRQGNKEEARQVLQAMMRSSTGSGPDPLAAQLIALSYLDTPQEAQGLKMLESIRESEARSALTFYLSGRLSAAMNDLTQAAADFQTALDLNPKHADAQLELLTLQVENPNERARAQQALEGMRKDLEGMSPVQKGRVHYLLARVFCANAAYFRCMQELKKAIQHDHSADHYRQTLADYYYARWEVDEALEEYKECQRLNPRNENCHVGLAQVYLAKGQVLKAQEALKNAEGNLGKTANLAYWWGRAFEEQKNWDESLRRYEESIGLKKTVRSLVAAARVYYRKGNKDKYGEYVQQARLIDANEPEIHILLGQNAMANNFLDEAQREFADILARNPDHVDGNYFMGVVLRMLKRREEAIASFDKVLKIDERNGRAHEGLGDTYFDQAAIDRAVVEYEAARQMLVKPDPELHFKLGMCYFLQKRWEEAKSQFSRAVALEPEMHKGHFQLGRVHFEQKDYEKARLSFEEAINHKREGIPDYFYWLGLTNFTMGHNQQALDNFDKAIAESKKKRECYAEALLYRGVSLRLMNDLPASVDTLKQAVGCNNELALAHKILSEIYSTSNKKNLLDQSEKHGQTYLRMNPDDPDAYRILAEIYKTQREFRRSNEFYRKAVDRNPTLCSAWREIAMNLRAMKDVAGSKPMLRRYLDCACKPPPPPPPGESPGDRPVVPLPADCKDIRNLLEWN